MIEVSKVIEFVKADLDAEGSDRYLFDQDFKPAINKTILWMTAALTKVFSISRVAGENMKDLKFVKVFLTSSFSRVSINPTEVGHGVWTILGVLPEPVVYPEFARGSEGDKTRSRYMSKLAFVKSEYAAARLIDSEWEETRNNPFSPGNDIMSGNSSLKTYAYLDFTQYTSERYSLTEPREIEIRPDYKNKLVGIRYLKFPEEIAAEDDSIELPETLMLFFSEKTANFISKKQGDGTTLFGVSEQEIQTLLSLIT